MWSEPVVEHWRCWWLVMRLPVASVMAHQLDGDTRPNMSVLVELNTEKQTLKQPANYGGGVGMQAVGGCISADSRFDSEKLTIFAACVKPKKKKNPMKKTPSTRIWPAADCFLLLST
eukprot:Lithocolla_globosa_v1_NODE_1625_length_2439_cov_4.699664.p2 type:complete len:117 gc:universal NODE_1625_length_2439_cov_4.699664:2038-2388(+)